MSNAHIFDMISRTVAERLPDCSVFVDGETVKVAFHGTEDDVSKIPCRLDIAIENAWLIGDAKLRTIRKNGNGYIAEYDAYAAHYFEDGIPS